MLVIHQKEKGRVQLLTEYPNERKRFAQAWDKEAYVGEEPKSPIGFKDKDRFAAKLLSWLLEDLGPNIPIPTEIPLTYWLHYQELIKRDEESLQPLPVFANWKPRPWQIFPIREALSQWNYAFFMEKGSGKTSTCLAVMSALTTLLGNTRFCVVVPVGLEQNWIRECKRFFPNLHPVKLLGATLADKIKMIPYVCNMPGCVLVLNYEMFRLKKRKVKTDKLDANGKPIETTIEESALLDAFKALPDTSEGFTWTAMALDESTKIRNHTEHGKGLVLARQDARRRYILSGNPAPQSPTDYVHQINFLNPAILPYNNHNQMIQQWGIKREDRGKDESPKLAGWSKKGLEKLHNRVNSVGFVLDREKLEAMGLRIPTTYSTIKVEMTEKQASVYAQMKAQMLAEYEQKVKEVEVEFEDLMSKLMGANPGVEVAGLTLHKLQGKKKAKLAQIANNGLVKTLRLSQITGGFAGGVEELDGTKLPTFPINDDCNPKLDRCVEEVLERRNYGVQTPIIIFSRFRAEIAYLQFQLKQKGVKVGTYQGGQGKLNDRNVVDFQEGRIDVLIVNPASGGFGLNLQRASIAIYVSSDFSLEKRDQSEARVRRDGQQGHVEIIDIVAVMPGTMRSTIDSSILLRLKEKKELCDIVLFKFQDFLEEELTEEQEAILEGQDENWKKSLSERIGFNFQMIVGYEIAEVGFEPFPAKKEVLGRWENEGGNLG